MDLVVVNITSAVYTCSVDCIWQTHRSVSRFRHLQRSRGVYGGVD